jgi:hypothetical protein
MQTLNRLTLNQETLGNLTANDQQNKGDRFISQHCDTKFLSCPECNPPRTAQE